MSTILDALRKVERDREVPRDELLDVELPPPRARRGISTRVIIACASVGFAAGIGLALWRDTAPIEQASPPEPVAAPAVDVPAPPRPRSKREAKAAPAAPAEGNPAVASAPAENPSGTAQVAAAGNAAPAPAPPSAAEAAAHEATALEPSPFAAAQGPAGTGAPPADAALPQGGPARGRKAPGRPTGRAAAPLAPAPPAAAAPLAPAPPPNAVAALAPPPPIISAPRPQVAPEAAPEPDVAPPAAPPSSVIDTGRAPTGAPRVALTFLQWSADPDRRFAFVSIDGAPSVRVREGDTASGMSVSQITPTGVQFQREGQSFIIRPRH